MSKGNPITRRELLKRGLAGSTLLMTKGLSGFASSKTSSSNGTSDKPNILVILVDEMRNPAWIPTSLQSTVLKNLYPFFQKSVNFQNHFTAAIQCSPARGSLVTGLYAQQHGLMATLDVPPLSPILDPAFPTYGRALQGLNYDTYWYGKWHLSGSNVTSLEQYGFGGGTFPDPVGTAAQGYTADPQIAQQFTQWLESRSSASTENPWCTTVSFVNPHDIWFFWGGSDCSSTPEANPMTMGNLPISDFLPASYFSQFGGNPCSNFENPNAFKTPKPQLQTQFSDSLNTALGPISFDINTVGQLPIYANALVCKEVKNTVQPFSYWYKLLQTYIYLHQQVDACIGSVLTALQNSPFADNTIVIFTADHGEYGGAHGLKGKGGALYDEALRVPLYVYDPTGTYTASVGTPRTALTSHVDFMPMLMTLASGGRNWTSQYPYLANRLDMTQLLSNPQANGRPYILHTTDEYCPGWNPQIPYHAIALRTAQGKLGVYSLWDNNSNPISSSQQLEFYDYRGGDFTEVNNVASSSSLTSSYYQQLMGPNGAWNSEIRAPLPPALARAQQTAYAAYLAYVKVLQSQLGTDLSGKL